jgi:Methyltransferase domain
MSGRNQKRDAGQSGKFIIADMYDHPFQTNAYDLVISHAALQHGFKAKVVSLVEKIHGLLVVNGGIRMLIVSG